MPTLPDILVQIVHIEGCRKGEIDEINLPSISIGRDACNDIVYPKKTRTVSRKHAALKREGNRYLLVNYSRNGCFVNGQLADQLFLKQGDVITFSRTGPKISFLFSIRQAQKKLAPTLAPRANKPNRIIGIDASIDKQQCGLFTLQYGTLIRSFRQQKVTLGSQDSKKQTNDFVIDHPKIADTQIEISYHNEQYYISNISDKNITRLNGQLVMTSTLLQENDIIQIGDDGPKMCYLGTGRLAELGYVNNIIKNKTEEHLDYGFIDKGNINKEFTDNIPVLTNEIEPDTCMPLAMYTENRNSKVINPSIKNYIKSFFI